MHCDTARRQRVRQEHLHKPTRPHSSPLPRAVLIIAGVRAVETRAISLSPPLYLSPPLSPSVSSGVRSRRVVAQASLPAERSDEALCDGISPWLAGRKRRSAFIFRNYSGIRTDGDDAQTTPRQRQQLSRGRRISLYSISDVCPKVYDCTYEWLRLGVEQTQVGRFGNQINGLYTVYNYIYNPCH